MKSPLASTGASLAESAASPAPDSGPRLTSKLPEPQRRWRSPELFGQAQEIEIEHGESVYRLRLTALGKLILTK